ncbi:hypothetical protein [Chryseobacterium sp. Mn2064]|uniref:hypothetical protein n=1 Tax=Chryseobacterium sp. Mn2064 TaxID=3395263 RepID=UPI003BBA3AB6
MISSVKKNKSYQRFSVRRLYVILFCFYFSFFSSQIYFNNDASIYICEDAHVYQSEHKQISEGIYQAEIYIASNTTITSIAELENDRIIRLTEPSHKKIEQSVAKKTEKKETGTSKRSDEGNKYNNILIEDPSVPDVFLVIYQGANGAVISFQNFQSKHSISNIPLYEVAQQYIEAKTKFNYFYPGDSQILLLDSILGRAPPVFI